MLLIVAFRYLSANFNFNNFILGYIFIINKIWKSYLLIPLPSFNFNIRYPLRINVKKYNYSCLSFDWNIC